jgi:hypothetical protein
VSLGSPALRRQIALVLGATATGGEALAEIYTIDP